MVIPAPRWDLLGEGKERFLGCTTAGLAGEHDIRRLPLASTPSGSSDRPRPDPSAASRRYTPLAATAPGRALRPPLPPLRRPPARRMVRTAGVAGGTNQQRPGGGIGAAGGRDGTGRGWQRAHHRERSGRSGCRGRLKCRGRGGARSVRRCRHCQRRPWGGE